jgi:hypothetical protein
MKENEMGGTHSRRGAHEERVRNLVVETRNGRNCLGYLGANWKAILKCILRNYGLRVLTGLGRRLFAAILNKIINSW